MNIHCPQKNCCLGSCNGKIIDNPTALISARKFFDALGISSIQFHVGSFIHWRTRAKLAIRGTSHHPKIGLFEPGTHNIVDMPDCVLHDPAINQGVAVLREWIIRNKIEIYEEISGRGLLRYVQFTVERSTKKVQVVLVVNVKNLDGLFADSFRDQLNHFFKDNEKFLHSVWLNGNIRRDNVIFGDEWRLIHGEKWLWEKLSGREICFHPASFMQANLEMFESLLKKLPQFVNANDSILELYAGTGAIGLSLIDKAKSLQCVEVVKLAKECFEESSKKLSNEEKNKTSFSVGASNQFRHLIDQHPNVIIIDPPRKGCGKEVLNALCTIDFNTRLIYISCGWDSFQLECKALLHSGWSIVHAEAFLFFPGTDHLEILAIFDRC